MPTGNNVGRRGPRPGHAATNGGRPKGVPNKRTRELIAFFDGKNFDPIEHAIKNVLAKGKGAMSRNDVVNACLRMAEFLYPKRKALDFIPQPSDQPTEIVYKAEWGNRAETSDAKEE